MEKIPTPLKLFGLNFTQYLIIAANFRAVAQGLYAAAFVTDIITCFVGMTIVKKIVDAKSWNDRLGYALGGALGAQVAIFVTKILFGH